MRPFPSWTAAAGTRGRRRRRAPGPGNPRRGLYRHLGVTDEPTPGQDRRCRRARWPGLRRRPCAGSCFAAVAVLTAGGAIWLREPELKVVLLSVQRRPARHARGGLPRGDAGPARPGWAPRELAAARRARRGGLARLLQTERHRRKALRSLAVAVLAVVGALLAGRGGSRQDGRRGAAGCARPWAIPAALLEGERHKAARLLGVTLEAPPAVVDAALAAQLAAHDLGRLDGIAPEVRRLLLEQRESLQRARDLLVRARRPGDRGPRLSSESGARVTSSRTLGGLPEHRDRVERDRVPVDDLGRPRAPPPGWRRAADPVPLGLPERGPVHHRHHQIQEDEAGQLGRPGEEVERLLPVAERPARRTRAPR